MEPFTNAALSFPYCVSLLEQYSLTESTLRTSEVSCVVARDEGLPAPDDVDAAEACARETCSICRIHLVVGVLLAPRDPLHSPA